MKPKLLFVGAFLSKDLGTKPISEKIKGLLEDQYQIRLVSRVRNKPFRLLNIALSVLFLRYKAIHVDTFSGANLMVPKMVIFLSHLRGKKVVLNLRGGRLAEFNEQNSGSVIPILKKADLIISPSQFLSKYFSEKGLNVTCLPNFIEKSGFPYSFKELDTDNVKLLWVRAFDKMYNPDLAIRTLASLRDVGLNVTMTMVGPFKGAYEDSIRLIQELELDEFVKLTGPIANDELKGHYHSHDIFLNTTSYESFGVAVLEAACCGVPIVSVEVGELPYIWENHKEIEMTAYNAKEIADKVFDVINDKVKHKRMSENARMKAQSFFWENIRPQWRDVLSEVILN